MEQEERNEYESCFGLIEYKSFCTDTLCFKVSTRTDIPEEKRVAYVSLVSSNAKSIVIPETITFPEENKTYRVVYFDDVPIVNVPFLETITIPASLKGFRSVTMCYVNKFNAIKNLKTVHVDPNNETFCSVDGVLFTKDMKTLVLFPQGREEEYYDIPDGVESIETAAFAYCRVKHVTFPNTMKNIFDYAFENSQISDFKLPESIEIIARLAFYNCKNITIFEVPENTTAMALSALFKCKNLKLIILKSTNTHIYEPPSDDELGGNVKIILQIKPQLDENGKANIDISRFLGV